MRMTSVAQEGIINKVDFTEQELDELLNDKSTSLKPANYMEYKDIPSYDYIVDHIVKKGIPLVLTNTTESWNRELFSWDWLRENLGSTQLVNSPRDNDALVDLQGWTVEQYIDYLKLDPSERKSPRLYGKDMPCPDQWTDYIANHLQSYFIYRGPCDLLADLQEELMPLNLMIYVGFGGTYTPGHKDICGSLGHNVMTYAEKDAYAVWFCVASKDEEKAAAYWQEHKAMVAYDNFFMPLKELAKAPFDVYVIKQKEGDFVLVPPECVHQVVNKGGRNIKIAWNTVTSRTIEISFSKVMPRLKHLGKPEIYRIKAVSYYSLIKRTNLIEQNKWEEIDLEDFPHLLRVLREAVHEEQLEKDEYDDYPSSYELIKPILLDDKIPHTRTCNFCHCDIFNRAFHCNKCAKSDSSKSKNPDREVKDLDYCLDCVAGGRGCLNHGLELALVEYLPHADIEKGYDNAKKAYMKALRKKKGLDARAAANYVADIENSQVLDKVPMATIAAHRGWRYAHNETDHCHQCKLHKPNHLMIRCRNGEMCQKAEYPGRPIVLPRRPNDTETPIRPPKDPSAGPDTVIYKEVTHLRFCAPCLWNRYGIRLLDSLRDRKWACPLCTDICNCAACLRRRGIVPEEYTIDPSQLVAGQLLYSEHRIDEIPDGKTGVNDIRPRPAQKAFGKGKVKHNGTPSESSSRQKSFSSPISSSPTASPRLQAHKIQTTHTPPPEYEGAGDLVWAKPDGEQLYWPAIRVTDPSLLPPGFSMVKPGTSLIPVIVISRYMMWADEKNVEPFADNVSHIEKGSMLAEYDIFRDSLKRARKIFDWRKSTTDSQGAEFETKVEKDTNSKPHEDSARRDKEIPPNGNGTKGSEVESSPKTPSKTPTRRRGKQRRESAAKEDTPSPSPSKKRKTKAANGGVHTDEPPAAPTPGVKVAQEPSESPSLATNTGAPASVQQPEGIAVNLSKASQENTTNNEDNILPATDNAPPTTLPTTDNPLPATDSPHPPIYSQVNQQHADCAIEATDDTTITTTTTNDVTQVNTSTDTTNIDSDIKAPTKDTANSTATIPEQDISVGEPSANTEAPSAEVDKQRHPNIGDDAQTMDTDAG